MCLMFLIDTTFDIVYHWYTSVEDIELVDYDIFVIHLVRGNVPGPDAGVGV